MPVSQLFRVPSEKERGQGWVRARCFVFSELDELSGDREGLSVDSSPRRRAVVFTQLASPRGLPRRTQRRTASNSCSLSGSFTRATQFASRAIGQEERSVGAGSIFCTQRQSDPQRQSSAPSVRLPKRRFNDAGQEVKAVAAAVSAKLGHVRPV